MLRTKHLPFPILMAVAALVLATRLEAQVYDVHGNVMVGTAAGPDAPGLPLGEVTHPINGNRHSDLDTQGHMLLAISAYDGQPQIYLVDWFSGGQIATIQTNSSNEFGIGYDLFRSYYLTTEIIVSASDLIKAYDGLNTTPVVTFPSPVARPVGITHDPLRDLWWIVCWQNNSINAVNPLTGALVTSFNTAAFGCTRPAGITYDPAHDELSVGGRDQASVFVINPNTGALITSFPVNPGANDPQGVAAFSSGGSLWTSSFDNPVLREYDNGHSLELDLDFSLPSAVSVILRNVPAGADCRFFFGSPKRVVGSRQ